MTDWAKIFTGLLFYASVEIHQVRRHGLWQLLPKVSSAFIDAVFPVLPQMLQNDYATLNEGRVQGAVVKMVGRLCLAAFGILEGANFIG